MNALRAVLILGAVAVVAAVAGCSDNGVEPAANDTSDQAAIAGTLAAVPDLLSDGLFDSDAQANMAGSLRNPNAAGVGTPIESDPFSFWRSITRRTAAFEFAFADTDTTGLPATAVVTLRRHLTGTFNIVPRDPNNPDLPDTTSLIRKPLDDLWKRRFLLQRVRVLPDDRAVWRIAAATAVDVTSKDATSAISSVRVQTSSVDTTLTDPDAFIRLRQVLRFQPDEVVTLTVTTPRTDDVVVFYRHASRHRFTNNGDGTYTTTFTTGTVLGWRHFGVNALSHATLFDHAAPYDSKAWIFPYVIAGSPDAEYAP
jgi:hypothetical protein